MPSLTVENYLKALLQIAQRTGAPTVAPGELATELEVAPGTVTSMLKTLAESRLANYTPYEGASLTAAGRKLALRVLRRHRLIELFLVRTLGLTWDRVHEEAEHMEHAVSDYLIDRIDEFLDHPEVDPHGDPIPSAEGEMRGEADAGRPLSSCAAGERVRIVRVVNQDPEFLRFLAESGLQLGTPATVRDNHPAAGVVTLDLETGPIALGHPAAEQVLVEVG
ncbi:MAG: metal-dependent transcriptional regulator [Planctomycetales bacterium]